MAHDVFLSHSSNDKTTADAVCAKLEARGIRCWVAPRDITPGSDWGEAIIAGIEASKVMVLVFSEHANESVQIKREIERAVSKGLVIVPFRIAEVMPSKALEYFLSTPHWLDAYTPPLDQHLGYLGDTVASILAGGGTELKPPKLAPRSKPLWKQPKGWAIAAILLLLGFCVFKPESPAAASRGEWKLDRFEIDKGATYNTPKFPPLFRQALSRDATGTLTVGEGGRAEMRISVKDTGHVAADADELRLTSNGDDAKVTVDWYAGGLDAQYFENTGADPNDPQVTIGNTSWIGEEGSGEKHPLAGTWRELFDMPGNWIASLKMTIGGDYTLTYTRTVKGLLTIGDGRFELESRTALPLEGSYKLGRGGLTLSTSDETSTWKRP